MSAIRGYIWLSECINYKSISVVLERFHTPSAVYVATKEQLLEILSVGEVEKILQKDFSEADRILNDCFEKEIRTMAICDSEYPDILRNIENPPLVLYYKGRIPDIENKITINIIGTRKPTAYGEIVAKKISRSLAKSGAIIVSGMALGIDTIANQSAIIEGKPTIAVLGCSVDVCYPKSNRQLMDDIIAVGAVISEFPPTTEPMGHNFPQRNRIMSGLAQGVLVVEAKKASGTLITANYALEQGRDIFAIPGNIDNESSEGCNNLIKSGAIITTSAKDILDEYNIKVISREEIVEFKDFPSDLKVPKIEEIFNPVDKPKKIQVIEKHNEKVRIYTKRTNMTEIESKIYDIIKDGAEYADDILAKSNLPATQVMSTITMLEIYGDICKIDKRIKIKED